MSKQNVVDLANTARECASLANSVSGTIKFIVQRWNQACQAAKMVGFTTEPRYTRRAQLAADMLRMAAQLDNIAEGKDPLTGEPVASAKKVKIIKASDLKVGDIFVNQSYAGELKVSGVMGSLTGSKETHISFEIGGGTSYPDNCNITILDMDAIHAEALEMNAETDRRRHCSVMSSLQNTIMERDDLPELVEACHAEALTEDKRFNWLANRWGLFHASIKWVQVEMLNAAHSEALRIDAEQCAAPVTCFIFQRNDGVQLALDSSCDVRFIRTSKNGEWFKAGFRNTDMEGYQPVESDVLFTSMPSRTLSYSDGVMVVSEA
ncbi:hypothetical protein OQ853_06595 [Enterobacter roggenkampii]|uniref:hypothetical protein n=1 Tax=Enterobacter roggenkampii TaxID=1812935 RepID=UPI0009C31C78|nr:hypothetical protein [Enterobacter roggenkampii]AQT88729.1 hypothetical protein B1H21_09200 [Enterobacter roggenkampii]ASG37993.1 hypothetical protein CES92_03055 [Enterobacter roggenkampii]EMF0891709.1 hypothetical protein [Enterobacter roggenkampii]MDK4549065.1 hypothetical protein [Enterobacter roggenkampii]MDX7036484.1 hypothetical protein [Enterobacter roggenkampii]